MASHGGKRSIRPHWRKMTWVILVVQVLFVVWLIAGINAENHIQCQQVLGDCAGQHDTAGTIGAGIIIFFWVAADVVLGIIWLVTRGRSCPACGKSVKKGLLVCKHCGHDFRGAPAVTA